jgi:hypothetical protein
VGARAALGQEQSRRALHDDDVLTRRVHGVDPAAERLPLDLAQRALPPPPHKGSELGAAQQQLQHDAHDAAAARRLHARDRTRRASSRAT